MRARLENDQTLRARAFFGRATGGRLPDNEYSDLLAQLSHFLRLLAPVDAEPLVALATADLGVAPTTPPCPALRLAEPLLVRLRSEPGGFLVGLAILGTSWARDTARSSRAPRKASFLKKLFQSGKKSLERLRIGLEEGSLDRQAVYATVEVLRGVVLGIAIYLDTEWPPPVFFVEFDLPPPPLDSLD
jgi:hypothetical protein